MKKSCIVACYDENTENLVVCNIRKLNPGMEIIVVKNTSELIQNLKCSENITIYFDKYFLGYKVSFELIKCRAINPNLNIVFVEKGDCSVFFGLRLYKFGVNSFICHIEDEKIAKGPLLRTFENLNYYPEEVLNSIENKEHLLERKSCSEITESEARIAMEIGFGKTLKEICYSFHIASGTIGSYVNHIKKKIGYKSFADFLILNNSTLNIRGSGIT